MNLEKILADHKKWLDDPSTGKRANLRGADLEGADLKGADLREADLRWANLTGADLTLANLARTNLRGAILNGANLRDANLRGANLKGANLRDANLTRANLEGANLRGAILDFASWPLWCGSFGVKVDERFIIQLVAHITRLDVDTEAGKAIQEALKPWANRFCKHQEIREV